MRGISEEYAPVDSLSSEKRTKLWVDPFNRALRAEGALEAFGVLQTRARGASEELEKIAKSPEPLIRGNAEAALRRINTPAFLPPVFEEMKFDLRGATNQNRSDP